MEQLSSLKNVEKVAKDVRSEVENGSGTWQVRFFATCRSPSFFAVHYLFRNKFCLQNGYVNIYLFCDVLIVTL